MKYISLLVLAFILVFAYVQYDLANKDHPALETIDVPDEHTPNQPKRNTPAIDSKIQAAGFVSDIKGLVLAQDKSGAQRTLQPSTQVFVGEMIETRDSSAEITLDDGTQITLKPETQFRIIDFSYKANSETNTSLAELLKGQLRIITGKIGKSKNDRYQLRTHIATIGIRGTDYSIRLCLENACKIDVEGKSETLNNGLYMGVLEGAIVASTSSGEYEIAAGKIFYQQSTQSESIEIEGMPGILFNQDIIDTFGLTTGIQRNSNRWIIHENN